MTDEVTPSAPDERPAAREPIPPDEARRLLDEALAPYLDDGWVIRVQHDYMAQLTQGRRNLEFHVDLLGAISITEKALTPAQDSGRLMAWVLLLVSFLLVLAIASALGWLN